MTELQLYRLLQKQNNQPEWVDGSLIVWIDNHDIQEFAELVCCGDDVNVVLKDDGSIALNIVSLCEECGIDPENILKKPVFE